MVLGLNFIKENTSFFGLDIGTTAIRLVKLKKSMGGRFELEAFGSLDVPEGLALSDSEIDKKQMSDLVKKLVHSIHPGTRNAIVSLPGNSVFTTVVNLPKMPESEIRSTIRYQAEQNIPLKLSEVRLDWQVIGQSADGTTVSVMIIAAPITKVQKMIKIAEGAELDVNAIEVDAVASARALIAGEPLFMIINIGKYLTELTVVKNNVVAHTRTIPIGGQVITRAIAQGLSVDEVQAEQLKRKFGIEKDKMEGRIFAAANPVLNDLREEIDRSIKYYFDKFGENISLIKLSGGASRTLGIQLFLSTELGVNIVYGNPWGLVSFRNDVMNQLSQNAQEFDVAVGLAMRGI